MKPQNDIAQPPAASRFRYFVGMHLSPAPASSSPPSTLVVAFTRSDHTSYLERSALMECESSAVVPAAQSAALEHPELYRGRLEHMECETSEVVAAEQCAAPGHPEL